jgi:uncharacterized membrane protein
MNNAHLHLVFNHLPIIFPIVGIIVLFIGIFIKSEVSKRNSYLIFILGAIASVAAMATGEGAEETVEKLAGISENLIKTHEEAAELFAGLSYVLGVTSLLSLIISFKNASLSKFSPFVVLIMALITLFFAQKAGNTGGEIRHSEIRNGATVQNAEQDATENEKGENTEKQEVEKD